MVNGSAFLIKFKLPYSLCETLMTTEVYPAAPALWFNIQAATEYEPDTCDFMESLENNNRKAFLKCTE